MKKKCSQCKKEKMYSEFYKRSETKDGYRYECKKCVSVNGKKPAARKSAKKAQLKYKYGITLEDAEKLRTTPCEICGDASAPSIIDHNHQTGKVRGALCNTCNQGIGLLKDSPIVLKRALEYLETRGHYGR